MKKIDFTHLLHHNLDYNELIESMLNAYAINEIILDYKHEPVDYRILEINQAFEELIELKKEDVIGKTILDILPQTEPEWIKICGDVALNQKDLCTQYYSSALDRTYHVRIKSPKKGIFITIFNDISSLKIAHAEVEKQKASYQSLFNNIRVGLIRTTIDEGKIIKANPACAELFGFDKLEDFMKISMIDLFQDTRDRRIHREKLLRKGKVTYTTLHMRDINAEPLTVSVSSSLHYENNLPVWIDSTIQNISAQQQSEEKLYKLAHIDALTELANRHAFMHRLDDSLQKSLRYKHKCAVLFLDLDGFKKINDRYGHSAGDIVLKTTATRLQGLIRKSDMVARMGGDEFTIIIDNFENTHSLNILAKKIINTVSNEIEIKETKVSLTTSIGISIYPDDASDLESILTNSDNAMYKAKELGKNTLQFFTEELNIDLVNKMVFENKLCSALQKNELHLFYKPRIETVKDNIVGLEASLRWNSGSYGWVSPDDFLPVASQSDMINKISSWAIRSACKEIQRLMKVYKKELTLSLSINNKSLESPLFITELKESLNSSQLKPSLLHLQVQQSALMQESTLGHLKELEKLGVKIIIDNFGKGISSIEDLEHLCISGLKIDKSFIQDLNKRSPSQTLLTLILLAKSFNANVIIDGIESELQLLILKQLDIHQAQGPHIYPSADLNDTDTLLSTL